MPTSKSSQVYSSKHPEYLDYRQKLLGFMIGDNNKIIFNFGKCPWQSGRTQNLQIKY